MKVGVNSYEKLTHMKSYIWSLFATIHLKSLGQIIICSNLDLTNPIWLQNKIFVHI